MPARVVSLLQSCQHVVNLCLSFVCCDEFVLSCKESRCSHASTCCQMCFVIACFAASLCWFARKVVAVMPTRFVVSLILCVCVLSSRPILACPLARGEGNQMALSKAASSSRGVGSRGTRVGDGLGDLHFITSTDLDLVGNETMPIELGFTPNNAKKVKNPEGFQV